jgi:hypothetical protein
VKREREPTSSDLLDAAKLEARAKKFGMIAPPAKALVAREKIEKRAKKFGKTVNAEQQKEGGEVAEKKQQRAERFKLDKPSDSKAEERKARFAKK